MWSRSTGPKSALVGQADVRDLHGVDADDPTADRVEGDLIVAHDHHVQGERDRRQHPALARDDGVDADELWLHDVLEVGDLLVETMIVIDEAVTVVLDPDVVLHREGDRRPRMRLELRAVHEEVRARDGLRRVDVVAQAPLVGERDLDLRLLLETVAANAEPLEHRIVAGLRKGHARRNGDAAALAHGELPGPALPLLLQRAQHALDELGPGVGVLEELACRHHVRFDERATGGCELQMFEPVMNDLGDSVRVVGVAVSKDDLGVLSRMLHLVSMMRGGPAGVEDRAQVPSSRT